MRMQLVFSAIMLIMAVVAFVGYSTGTMAFSKLGTIIILTMTLSCAFIWTKDAISQYKEEKKA